MKIALIADSHLAPHAPAFNANTEAALAWIDQAGADLAVHLGDITADGIGEASQLDFAAQVLRGLKTPIRCIAGNHDIGDNPAGGVAEAHDPLDPSRLAHFETLFDEERWSLEVDGWTLIGLNAQRFGFGEAGEAAQFAWLGRALGAARGPCGLFLHKPLFRTDWNDDLHHPRYAPLPSRRRLQALLTGVDLRFVVSGHTHQWRRGLVDGVEHVWAPSCAFTIPDLMQEPIGEKRVGALILTLKDGGHSIELHRPEGLLDQDLADHPEVYPELERLLQDLRDGKPYPHR
jgi:3',5'-cyclic AMP phosphodiesterase CpdA